MKCVVDMTLLALRGLDIEELPFYQHLLHSSFDAHPVPFGQRWYGEAYRKRARDPSWFLQSLIANAHKEAEGAQQLWEISAHTADLNLANKIQQHAIDEARHAKLYLKMAKITFPDAATDEKWRELTEMVPKYTLVETKKSSSVHDFSITLDELIQTNIGEIRTRIHQLLLRGIIVEHCAVDMRKPLEKIVDQVLHDETCHIAYTGEFINAAMRDGHKQLAQDIMFERLQQFNTLTLKEVGAGEFDGSCANENVTAYTQTEASATC